MKNFKKVLVICLLVIIQSCKSEDTSSDSLLIGTWNLVSIDHNSTVTGIDINSSTVGVGRDINYTYTFNESPNEVISDGSFALDLTTTSNGETTEHSIGTAGSITSNWTLEGNQLTYTWETGNQVNTITKLEENILIYTLNRTDETNLNGTVEITVTEETYTFSR